MSESTIVSESDTASQFPDRVPTRIGKYEIHDEVGRGACGVVYRGFDPFVQRDVAIKVALADPNAGDKPGQQRTFFAEARAAGMLQHPNIVALYDAGVEGELSYIVMEFIAGETLLRLCRPRAERASIDQVIELGYKCARALDYAHGKGVLHRDIKPGNIMLMPDGSPKLMDFSIAEILSAEPAAGPRSVVGSPLYMSPEQIQRQNLGPTSDLYSLGAVLFQLIAGAPPFSNPEIPLLFRAIREQPAPHLRDLRPDVPIALSEIVERLLSKQPDQRYASGQELASALLRVQEQMKGGGQTSRRDSRDAIRRLHFFNGFTDEQIDEILNASVLITYSQGETLVREGDVDNAFFIIARGSADVLKGGKVISRLDKGDCVGEIAFLTAARRTATVTAATSMMALKINATLLGEVSRDCQLAFYKVFTETLIYRLSLTSAKLSAAAG